jgi:hypothetical protein
MGDLLTWFVNLRFYFNLSCLFGIEIGIGIEPIRVAVFFIPIAIPIPMDRSREIP